MSEVGYTLPVFAVAAAKGALLHLLKNSQDSLQSVVLDLLSPSPSDPVAIPIAQVATLTATSALAITYSDPGDHLDLTRQTPVWAWIRLQPLDPRQPAQLNLEGGEGIGRTAQGDPAIYRYAQRLFAANLQSLIPSGQALTVQVILPEGKRLATRTSNAAFGIVEGLGLLGTSGLVQPVAASESLETSRATLQTCLQTQKHVVFYIGHHGHQVALRLGFPPEQLVQTANWIGPLLVEAGLRGARSVGLVGYHGKLLKLAGGIFNTSSHLADARMEILTAAVIRNQGTLELAQMVLAAPTIEAAYQQLGVAGWADRIFTDVAQQIQQRAQNYVYKYTEQSIPMRVVLFDRQGQIVVDQDPRGIGKTLPPKSDETP